MKERKRHRLSNPVDLHPTDLLVCTLTDNEGNKKYRFVETCKRRIFVDTIVTFDVDEPLLGLVDGIGAIFGDSGER